MKLVINVCVWVWECVGLSGVCGCVGVCVGLSGVCVGVWGWGVCVCGGVWG